MKNEYITTDFWLASFLKAKKVRIFDIRKNQGRSTFVFEGHDEIKELVRDFYNDGTIGVNTFKNAVQDMKSLIHNY